MKVLLADDHGIVRDGLRWMLSGEPDIEVIGEAADGCELLEALSAHDGEIDVVLLDIRMPGVGGLEALQQLAARDDPRGPAVVILSMHQEPAVVRRAIELGAAGYLLKSTSREELLTALRHVAAGNAYVMAEVTGPLLDHLAGREPSSPSAVLTPRERDVLRLVAAGHTNRQVAAELGISEATVKTHLKDIFAHLDVVSRAEAVAMALQRGLLAEPTDIQPT